MRRVCLAVLTLVALPAQAQVATPHGAQGLAADFDLTVQSPGQAPQHSVGQWQVTGDASQCLRVHRPIAQEIALTGRELRLWFPDRRLLLRQAVKPGHPPPVLDALIAGLADVARTLPAGAELISQERMQDGQLRSEWRVRDRGGQVLSELATVESAQGTRAVDLRDGQHHLLRTYRFGPRQRVETRAVPARIDATYRTVQGRLTRTETWILTHPRPLPMGAPGPCAQPTGPHDERAL